MVCHKPRRNKAVRSCENGVPSAFAHCLIHTSGGKNMHIQGDMSIGIIMEIPELAKIRDLIFTNLDQEKYDSLLQEYGMEESRLSDALEYTAQRCKDERFLLPVYRADSQCSAVSGTDSAEKYPSSAFVQNTAASWTDQSGRMPYRMIYEKEDVLLLNYAVHPGKPYILVCPGGGYNREWVLVEGYPLALRINELGYNAFILIYRTGKTGLFPQPLEDLAAAVDFIERNKEILQVETKDYAVTGASAGGHLCAVWGSRSTGWGAYGTAKPKALLLSYPAAVLSMFYDNYEKCLENGDTAGEQAQAAFLKRVGGAHFSREDIGAYSLENLISNEYPSTFLVHAQDDPTVPVEVSLKTAALLEQHGIQNEIRIVRKAGHSFGLGIGTDAQGWLDDAVCFWQESR